MDPEQLQWLSSRFLAQKLSGNESTALAEMGDGWIPPNLVEDDTSSEDDELSVDALHEEVVAMGSNRFGQLGRKHTDANSTTIPAPRSVLPLLRKEVRMVACGEQHTLAVVRDEDGSEKVVAFGSEGRGQLGKANASMQQDRKEETDGQGDESMTQKSIDGGWSKVMLGVFGGRGIKQVACGAEHSGVLGKDGTLVMFGCNAFGQLGIGERHDAFQPLRNKDEPLPRVWTPPKGVRSTEVGAVACGARHTLVVMRSGEVIAFGGNDNGQLGRRPQGFRWVIEDTPLRVSLPPG